MCETCHQTLTELSQHQEVTNKVLASLVEVNRALLMHQRAQVPKLLQNARQYLSSATSLQMNWHMQTQQLLNVTSMIVTATSPGTLQINERTWSFNGQSIIVLGTMNGLVVRPEDYILLTQTTAGALGLEFLGEELPDRGQRW